MYQCFHCLQNKVVWDADFDFSDLGIEGAGVVHVCHCTNCGAVIHVMSGVLEDSEDMEKNIVISHASST